MLCASPSRLYHGSHHKVHGDVALSSSSGIPEPICTQARDMSALTLVPRTGEVLMLPQAP